MDEPLWILKDPLEVKASVEEPYLLTGQGTLGGHQLATQFLPDTGQGPQFRVLLEGQPVFELGMGTPAGPWFRLCRDLGYDPERHWDLDPALILFRQVVPRLAQGWEETALPFNELGLPEGVVCLATVRAAWERALAGLGDQVKGDEARAQVVACLQALPLRAVVFHDDPGHREDYVWTDLDEPLLGVFLRLGPSRSRSVTLAKATLNGTGGLRWSPWETGGEWREEGREFQPTLGPRDFLERSGVGEALPGFEEAFVACLTTLMEQLDPVVEAYRHTYPAEIPWHRDPLTRFLDHTIVEVRLKGDREFLVLDDGTEVEVAGLRSTSRLAVSGEPGRQVGAPAK